MKKNKKHIPAFTLMNVMTGIVISGILVGSVYYIYTNIFQNNHTYESIRFQLNDFLIAKADINRNIEKSKDVFLYPNGFSILNSENEQTLYLLEEKNLIKKTKNYQKVLFSNVKEIKFNQDVAFEEIDSDVISSIYITFLIEKQEISVYIYKLFDTRNKVNQILLQ